MEKKESNKKESPKKNNNISPRISGLSNKAFGIIKFILGICLLPFVYSFTVGFLTEFSLIEKALQRYFWSGVISLVIIYLFVWEPVILYTKGQKLVEIVFVFFRSLVKFAPFVLPIYTIILFILYGLVSSTGSASLLNVLIFLIGFSAALHLVFSAKAVRSKQGDFLKANHIFGFSLIYIINVVLLAIGLNLIFREFSLVNFFNNSFQITNNIFYAVFKQLFLNR